MALARTSDFCKGFFGSTATLTEKNLPDQKGKVFFVTGGTGGVGYELVDILYQHNAKVYFTSRTAARGEPVVASIRERHPSSTGSLHVIELDLGDLTTIKAAAEKFLAAESTLNVLWLNAGVLGTVDAQTAQGYELHLGINNLGHFLLQRYLYPALRAAAAQKSTVAGSTRVVWVSSNGEAFAPNPPVDMSNLDFHRNELPLFKYGRSKAANIVHSAELARRAREDGIVSIALHPGGLRSDLFRQMPAAMRWFINTFVLYPVRQGAYTELYAGLSPDVGFEPDGVWVMPFGRKAPCRLDHWNPDLGGQFWEWCEKQVEKY